MTKLEVMEKLAVSCPSGDGGTIVKNGTQGGHQRYMCRACGRQFREPDSFQKGHRFRNEQIGSALQWYFDGLTYGETVNKVAREFGMKPPDEATVYRWVRRYSRVAAEALVDYRARTGIEWVMDQVQVQIGGALFWHWTFVDRHTRFLLASHLTTANDIHQAALVFGKAKAAAVDPPEVVCIHSLRSDGMVKLSLQHIGEVEYTANLGTGEEIAKTLSARLPASMRQPDEMLCSVRTPETAQNFLDGWRVDYNLFRPHLGLGGRTPAQAAGMDVRFSSWQDVVGMVEPRVIQAGRLSPKGGGIETCA